MCLAAEPEVRELRGTHTFGVATKRALLHDRFEITKDGDDRARTGNLRLAKPALSQLSYVPFRSL